MAKHFDEFEEKAENGEFQNAYDELDEQMEARFDRLLAQGKVDARDRNAAVLSWTSQRWPIVLLRLYHEWITE